MAEPNSSRPWLLPALATLPALILLVLLLVPNSPLVERIVRGYILAHPEIIPDAVEKLRARENAKADQAEAEARKALPGLRAAIEKPYASAWAGNPNGDITVVAFMDYACGYCRASLPGLAELIAKDPGVRVVYREFPVLGPESGVAARWALAAAEQGKFRAFHDAMFAEGQLSEAGIAAAAAKAGLDTAAAQKAIGTEAVRAELAANHKFGEKLAMTGTPSWVIGGQLYYGARDYDGLAEAVAAARKK